LFTRISGIDRVAKQGATLEGAQDSLFDSDYNFGYLCIGWRTHFGKDS
jgi:hypothetical protein